MAENDRISVRFNQGEEDLRDAFFEVLAEERKRDENVPEQAVAKKLMRRGLQAASEKATAASIIENELAIIKRQGAETAQTVRKLEHQLEDRIKDLRADLATTVMVLLEHAGKVSAAKAKEWVETEFNS